MVVHVCKHVCKHMFANMVVHVCKHVPPRTPHTTYFCRVLIRTSNISRMCFAAVLHIARTSTFCMTRLLCAYDYRNRMCYFTIHLPIQNDHCRPYCIAIDQDSLFTVKQSCSSRCCITELSNLFGSWNGLDLRQIDAERTLQLLRAVHPVEVS